jgi:Lar family restriction alleviation protein
MWMMKLRLCPFCGGKATLDYCDPYCCEGVISVDCMHCGCSLPISYSTEEEAVNKWNTRFKVRGG